MGDAGDDDPDEPRVKSLLKVHLLHGLHGLPLGQVRLEPGDLSFGLATELLVGSLLGDRLVIQS